MFSVHTEKPPNLQAAPTNKSSKSTQTSRTVLGDHDEPSDWPECSTATSIFLQTQRWLHFILYFEHQAADAAQKLEYVQWFRCGGIEGVQGKSVRFEYRIGVHCKN